MLPGFFLSGTNDEVICLRNYATVQAGFYLKTSAGANWHHVSGTNKNVPIILCQIKLNEPGQQIK
jgi:hypothetical protein